jgi:hypothetical protein
MGDVGFSIFEEVLSRQECESVGCTRVETVRPRLATHPTGALISMQKKSQSPLPIFVALLRGINVGGNNMIRMSSLKTSFERMGFKDVTTYINSGNLIFKAKEDDARKLERNIEKMLSREYKLGCKVVVRSFSEMATW